MVVHHLEMETDDEELTSLTAEISNGHSNSNNNNNTKVNGITYKKTRVLLGLGSVVAILLLVLLSGGNKKKNTPNFTGESKPQDVEYKTKPPTNTDHTQQTHKTTTTQPPTQPPVLVSNDTPNSNTQPTPTNEKENEKEARPAFSYAKMATIVPDPDHVYVDSDTKAAIQEQFGKWHFWDGDDALRPTTNYCANYKNCDVPGDQFPESAWQVDAVFVNHLVNDAEQLISRAMEAIFTEYGHGKPLPPEQLAARRQMFHWDLLDLNDNTNNKPPAAFQKKGDRGNGGWTTKRSLDGLVTRLLHAIHTNDEFVVVLGGHSAAAGHGNHFHQSYMMQFHKIMAPVFARLGVKLVTKNMAQGGLGTLQNAIGMADLYGDNIDLLLWDSAMTETNAAHVDLFLRQGLLSGKKVPVVWGGPFSVLRTLHNKADVDVGEFGYATDGVTPVTSEAQAATLPFAARYLKCDHERQELCDAEPRFCTHCWVDRDDINGYELFPEMKSQPSGQVKWHPGWRHHQLVGRNLAFAVLDALQIAVQTWSDGTMGGPPLDEDWWHVTDYYDNIRSKLSALSDTPCFEIAENLPERLCTTKMQARSQFTPRNDPERTSLSSIIVPASNGYVPTNTQVQMYDGPDVHNQCYDIPPDGVDVLEIVSGRRKRRELVSDWHDANNHSSWTAPTYRTLSSLPIDDGIDNFDSHGRATTRNLSAGADAIEPGLGWQVVLEPPGLCNGEYNSICGRAQDDPCPMLGHHDHRGAVVGNEFAGWLVMDLPNLSQGIVVLKLVTYLDAQLNTRTDGWTAVNNEREGRRILEHTEPRRLAKLEDLPESFVFDYAIDGKITSLAKAQFLEQLKNPQRVVEVLTILDDPSFTSAPKTTRIAFRMRGCGRECTIALSHVYWA